MFFMEESKNYGDFLDLTSREDVATYLGGSLKNLSYNFYVLPKDKQYTKFTLPKKKRSTTDMRAYFKYKIVPAKIGCNSLRLL